MGKHDREHTRRFLDDAKRQVWARDRASGEPIYIEDGTADAVREVAKSSWACIVPGCSSRISVRGGTKRDHLFHLSPADHAGGRESIDHLAAKAMLTVWAREQVADEIDVREERTVKEHHLRVHRRPDVLVSWPTGQRVALEVEYKDYAVERWAEKQRELDAARVRCVWLIGHSRVRELYPDGGWLGECLPVKVPYLADVLAHAGHEVLVINPVTRQVGTLVGDPDGATPFQGWRAFLVVDELRDCRIDPSRGITTPALSRIRELMGSRDADADGTRPAGYASQPTTVAASPSTTPTSKWGRIELERATAWNTSRHRRRLLDRYGDVPALIASDSPYSYWIHALPEHWHAVIFEERVHQRPLGYVFDLDWCFEDLQRSGIGSNWTRRNRQQSVTCFLERLERAGLVQHVSLYKWRVQARFDPAPGREAPVCPARTSKKSPRRTSLPRGSLARSDNIVERYVAWKEADSGTAWCHKCQRPLAQHERLHEGHKFSLHPSTTAH